MDYLLALLLETWTIQPLKTTPCAYFSFVNIGGDRILKIGGNDGVNKASNKVHILNLRQMVRSSS